MLLKHSTNMILSQLKSKAALYYLVLPPHIHYVATFTYGLTPKLCRRPTVKHISPLPLATLPTEMKGNQRIHTKGTTMKVKNTKQQEAQFEQRSFSKKQMDKQPTADGKMDQVVYPRYNSSSVKDCHQVVVGSNSGGSSPVGGKNGDLTLQGVSPFAVPCALRQSKGA